MPLPEFVTVRTLAGGAARGGLLVDATIETDYKNPFSSIHGPSNASGLITISRATCVAEGLSEANVFLMDYGHPEKNATGRLFVAPMNLHALQRALAAYRLYSPQLPYPPHYEETLLAAERVLRSLPPEAHCLQVIVVATSEPATVIGSTKPTHGEP